MNPSFGAFLLSEFMLRLLFLPPLLLKIINYFHLIPFLFLSAYIIMIDIKFIDYYLFLTATHLVFVPFMNKLPGRSLQKVKIIIIIMC